MNADAPVRIAALANVFREEGLPVIHIRHRDEDPASPLHAHAKGCPPMPCDEAVDGEPVFLKRTSSAFASTDLAAYLHGAGVAELAATGAVAGFRVDTTVRSGADLGFAMTVVRDAVMGFDLPAAGPSARIIFDVTMAHLEADFARLTDTRSILAG